VKRKRLSVEQIVAVLKQAELGVPVVELIHNLRRLLGCSYFAACSLAADPNT
jgi:hypothetical protein